MKRQLILMSMLMASLWASAQDFFYYDMWPNGAPNTNEITAEETTNEPWTNVKTARMTVYKSDRPQSKCIVMCPGGGYSGIWWDNEGVSFAKWMHNQHITFIVLKYRLPNVGHHEVPLTDVQEALRLVREHADEWNVDPHKVGVMGASAGGHLAATASTLFTNDENRPDFQVLLYPVISLQNVSTHKGTRYNLLGGEPSAELVSHYSADEQVTDKTPPAFIVLATDDWTVSPLQSLKYYEALLNHKISATMHIYPTGGHGFGCQERFAYKNQWLTELEHWLNTVM